MQFSVQTSSRTKQKFTGRIKLRQKSKDLRVEDKVALRIFIEAT